MSEDPSAIPTPQPTDEERWPAVRAAYGFVLPSYQMLAARFEAADTRLTVIVNLAATLTLGAPIFAKAVRGSIAFSSPWFIAAVVLFVSTCVVGMAGRVRGSFRLPNPGVYYRESLHESEWTFMKNAIYFAGEHFDQNVRAIRRKGNAAFAAAVLFGLEVLALVGWIAR